jgi:hypothetical protein
LGGNVLIALAGLFPDGPQVLLAGSAMLFRVRQVMHHKLAFEVPRQRQPAFTFVLPSLLACGGLGARATGKGSYWNFWSLAFSSDRNDSLASGSRGASLGARIMARSTALFTAIPLSFHSASAPSSLYR